MQKGQSHMRSEKIRRRLNEESKNWIDQASRHITDPSPLNIQNHGHMKIDNLNNGQDATKRNMFFKIGWRLLSFILTAAFSLAIFSAWQSPQYKVSDVHI
ncbi:MAG: hypothetical protein J7L66_02205, partial [Anaerolineaceae bacterium]|nr:hypothetical protein [Anaerolineaceae bacterium]